MLTKYKSIFWLEDARISFMKIFRYEKNAPENGSDQKIFQCFLKIIQIQGVRQNCKNFVLGDFSDSLWVEKTLALANSPESVDYESVLNINHMLILAQDILEIVAMCQIFSSYFICLKSQNNQVSGRGGQSKIYDQYFLGVGRGWDRGRMVNRLLLQ